MTRFSLQDVKKSIQRRNGELAVTLHFLRPGEAEAEITRCIEYYEKNLGKVQHSFSADEARGMVGDYRMANCLLASLSHWYSWQNRDWQEVVQEQGGENLHEISSSVQLRLAMYSFVNEQYQGFLPTEKREEAFSLFAARYQIQATELDYLLSLDNEEEALLSRSTQQIPKPQEIATLYNQWVFEAALFNASSVHFMIDCQAFLGAERSESAATPPLIESGIGTAIKRLCYQARTLGVYYDLNYEQEEKTGQGRPTVLHLTLYGPQDVTGAPQHYGMRLARLCRQLLAYNRKNNGQEKRGKKVLGSAIIKAEATIHFLQRAYRFEMDARLLGLLPSQEESLEKRTVAQEELYDSSVEQQIAEAFQGMARRQGVDGWQLEREPEPLLLKKSIMIPDFALTREKKCIYVEILGYWTPSYRERKIQKLQQLRERNDLLLIIPQEAREAFATLTGSFPIVYYDQKIALSELLQIVRIHYDDFSERLAAIEVEKVRAQIKKEGLITEHDSYQHLHGYRRSEIQQAAQMIINEQIGFLAGLGFYDRTWMEEVRKHSQDWLEKRNVERLSDLLVELRKSWNNLKSCEDSILEVLLTQWPEVQIERTSIFEVQVHLKVEEESQDVEGEKEQSVESSKKKYLKEQHLVKKKRIEKREETTMQENLW